MAKKGIAFRPHAARMVKPYKRPAAALRLPVLRGADPKLGSLPGLDAAVRKPLDDGITGDVRGDVRDVGQ